MMEIRSRVPSLAPEPGLVIEIGADESFRIVVPPSTEARSIAVTLEQKHGQRSRLRVVAHEEVRLLRQPNIKGRR